MNSQEFSQLRFDLQALASDIINKLEEIRCGVIDVENLLEKIVSAQEPSAASDGESVAVVEDEVYKVSWEDYNEVILNRRA